MLQLQQTQRYSVLAAAPPPPPPRVLLTQGDAPAPPPKVLITQGDASFVEHADGRKEWIQRTEDDDWRATLRGYLNKAAMDDDDASEDPTTIVKRALEDWREGHAVVLRGLLSPKAVAEVHACARDCLDNEWGTVRRRSVGLPDGSVFPQQTHARLSKHFRDQCLRAWAALWRGIAGVDWGTWPRFSGDVAVRNAFKQADYLLYQGGDRQCMDQISWNPTHQLIYAQATASAGTTTMESPCSFASCCSAATSRGAGSPTSRSTAAAR